VIKAAKKRADELSTTTGKTVLRKEGAEGSQPIEHHQIWCWCTAVSPLINLEMQHDGRSARVGWKEFNYFCRCDGRAKGIC
jgi:hypothetical protein